MGRTSLPPGFRFHPTDVELILYYLKRKIMGKKPHFFEAISELNICRFSPWDLPDKSCLKSKDLEWYFFSPREKKYASGARMNRATETGYWKTTGRDRPVIYDERTVGMVKTLVFHEGHAPKGKRTDWLIHEYRIEDLHTEEPTLQDSYVLCKVFKKNGPGPKNGAQYGAPFKEEDWEDDFETSDEPIPSAVFPAKRAYPINQIRSAVTGMIDPGCSSAQPTAEPAPSLSSLDTDEVPPNNQNCSVFTGVVDSGATLGQSLARPGPSLAMPHPSEVPSDDDISRFFASFPDDTYLLPIENIENVNNCNRGLNGDMMPCMDGNYSAFGGHDNFADVSGGRSNFPGMVVTDHPPNSLFPQDDASFLELDDLIIPVEHCARASETQPLVEGNLYPSNDSFLDTGNFNYGGNFSGYNQFIPTQSQLQVLPEQYSQQVTATEFNTNQGYNTWYDYGYDTPMHQNEFTDEKR